MSRSMWAPPKSGGQTFPPAEHRQHTVGKFSAPLRTVMKWSTLNFKAKLAEPDVHPAPPAVRPQSPTLYSSSPPDPLLRTIF
eukprot:gene6691-biopygen1074